MATTEQVEVKGPVAGRAGEVLTQEALDFVGRLQREFGGRRQQLLAARDERQARIDAGEMPDFLSSTSSVRSSEWSVAVAPHDLQDRRVEITGPTDRKMLINALNSGARVFMADFEDANSPTWSNLVEGQVNLIDAIERRLTFTSPEGKEYRLNEKVATLLVRPRGWHLDERHVLVGGRPISGSLFDFGLYFFHRRGFGMTSSTSPRMTWVCRAARFVPPFSSRPSLPRSRWTRSFTSCAITRAG